MVVALVILTIAVGVTVDLIRRGRAKSPVLTRPAARAILSATKVIDRYYHPAHTWARVEEQESVTVGADDLAQHMIGNLDRIEIAAKGSTVRQGEPFVKLHRGRRALILAAPLSGVVKEVNSELSKHPSLLRDSPYEKGWIARIAPINLLVEVRNLLKGSLAERWRENAQAQVASWFSPRLGMVLQDGGKWVDNPSDLLNDNEWRELTQELLFIQPSEQSTAKSS